MHPLDQLSSLHNYTRLFTDARFWAPYVFQACALHKIPCRQVTGGIPGTCPTFIVDRRVVVKFFGALFNGQRSFAVERSMARLLAGSPQFPAAALLAEGALNPAEADWQWPFLIFEYLPGKSYAEIRQQVTHAEQIRLAFQLGGWVRALHALPIPQGGPFEKDLTGFTAFLEGQRSACAARLARWGSLPEWLVSQVEDYLIPAAELVRSDAPPHIIHADITGDHLLGQVKKGRWVTGGLIDFGDARTGSLYYELPALHLDFFRGDRRLLGTFLDAYGFVPPPDFPRRALSFCLLHEFDLFTNIPEIMPGLLEKCQALPDLAEHLWRV